MEHIFYFIGILFLIYEVYFLLNLKNELEESKRFKELTKEFKNLEWNDYSEEYKKLFKKKAFVLIFLFWLFIGLASSQWVLFLIFLLFQFIIIIPISDLVKFSFYRYFVTGFNTVVGIIFSLFLILNKYHFKLNLYEILINYFN